jgi:hypothetical protein
MLDVGAQGSLGNVLVFASTDSGHSPEQMADMALNRIMVVNETAPPVIRDQALAHRDKLREVLIYYMNSMAKSERTTIWALMKKQGREDIAEIIRRL